MGCRSAGNGWIDERVNECVNECAWDLSLDGTQIVLYSQFASWFAILSLQDKRTRRIDAKGDIHLRTMTWSALRTWLLCRDATEMGAQLLYLDLRGKTHVLEECSGNNVFLLGRPSPDGRHIAIQTSAKSSNMWMIENF
ncbi:MAG: hypothetical protein DMG34_00710 [Acidobacteria bacterium]|nr:MAG: hypothetical protein DMG34_00710 [Acidobacteriota bacterium]